MTDFASFRSRKAHKYILGSLLFGFCAMITLPSLTQPVDDVKKAVEAELSARREGRPFAKPVEPKLEGLLVTGTLETNNAEAYQFTSAAGEMMYITDRRDGRKFGIVMTPILETPSPSYKQIPTKNFEKGHDLTVHSFQISGFSLEEVSYLSLSTKKNELFSDGPNGSLVKLFGLAITNARESGTTISTNSLCCVSSDSYIICGDSISTTSSSCGLAPPPQNRD